MKRLRPGETAMAELRGGSKVIAQPSESQLLAGRATSEGLQVNPF